MKNWQIIDLVRSFSIIAVIAHHFDWVYLNANSPSSHGIWNRFQLNGGYGVYLFFIVSGFLITAVIKKYTGDLFKPNFREFYSRRSGRILPLYVTLAIGIVLLLIFMNNLSWPVHYFFSAKKDPVFWLSIATFTFNWAIFLDLPFSHCGIQWFLLWSVCVEEQFYFLYPFVLKKLGSLKKLVVFLVIVLMAGILWRLTAFCLLPEKRNFQLYNSFASFDLIAIGILLYLAKERWEAYLKGNKKSSLLVCSIGFLIMLLTWMTTSSNNGLDLIYAPTAMGLGLFLFLLGGFQLPIFELKSIRFLSLPGKYCYGNYLFQYFFLCFTEPYILSRTNNTPAALLIVVILSTTVSGLSFHYFEMPANHLIRRMFSKNQLLKNG